MFTGLVERKGVVVDMLRTAEGGMRLGVSLDLPESKISLGESIAVNGVCLTVTESSANKVVFDVVPNTLRKSGLSLLKLRSEVNVETSLQMGDKLDGHFVTGHIDGVREVLEAGHSPEGNRIDIALEPGDRDYLVTRGSVAVDGVSLTVSGVWQNFFRVFVIPHTAKITTLGSLRRGKHVNVEFDIMAKYAAANIRKKDLTFKTLKDSGFMN